MRFSVLLSAATAALLAASPAWAQCEGAGTVVCAGADTDGFEDASDGVSLSVLPGASVTSEGDAIKLEGEGAYVLNEGAVEGGDEGIVVGAYATVVNDGTVVAGDKAIDADGLDGVSVVNTGSIEAGDKGVRIADSVGATLDNSGTITAVSEAFEGGDDAMLTNTGLIESTEEDGVQVQLGATIVNEGTIYGGTTNGDGIDIDGGLIVNRASGLIESRSTDLVFTEDGPEAGIDIDAPEVPGAVASVEILNDGVIRGEIGILEDYGNLDGHVIVNAGAIISTREFAIDLNIGDDLVELVEGGTFEGTVSLGEGEDDLLLTGIMDADVGGMPTLFDGGEGEDFVSFDPSVALGDIVSYVMSDVFEGAMALTFANEDGSLSTLSLIDFELFGIGAAGDQMVYSLSDLLGSPVPLPAGLPLFGTALGLGAVLRRRARRA
ncbi:hypothetical protein [Parvularcula dongshanensis]|uniref:VPLPA-CTERM sorting domain-containing protein n=1 Tax=Parvularcula dongshanensis TaxID=1173995 RepID=A0A840HZJ7_9PROT|nr:hypothetical protein [Parvularcula dongshanensis]MBB4658266.1 hypothetical protein [Parvularcula dongshanensis]